jgi:glycerol-3-phosphate acyltransferase PlsY
MTYTIALSISIILPYLLGSIPFGYVLTKFAGMGDIRTIGSGNIGATNVLRTGNKKLAALTLFLDGFKGTVAVTLIAHVFPGLELLAGFSVLLGHLFPVWLNFKGGKGVATAIGVITALAWPVGILCMVIWIVVAIVYRYSSLAALVALGLTPIEVLILGRSDLTLLMLVIVLLVFWKHKANIERLIKGSEPKIGADKQATTPTA